MIEWSTVDISSNQIVWEGFAMTDMEDILNVISI